LGAVIIEFGGTSFVIIAPISISEFSPIITPGFIEQFNARKQLFSILTLAAILHPIQVTLSPIIVLCATSPPKQEKFFPIETNGPIHDMSSINEFLPIKALLWILACDEIQLVKL